MRLWRLPRAGLILGVAEDGITIQTKAASAEYVVQEALHLNMNTQSVAHARLRAPGLAAKIKDLGIPVDLAGAQRGVPGRLVDDRIPTADDRIHRFENR